MTPLTSRVDLLRFLCPPLAVVGLWLTWQPDFSTNEEGEADFRIAPSSRSLRSARSQDEPENEFATLIEKAAEKDGSSSNVPRAVVTKLNPAEDANPDAGGEEDDLSSIVERQAAEKLDRVTGIRLLLLKSAAERALHSDTPWSELSQVAVAYRKIGDIESSRYWFQRASRLAINPKDSDQSSLALRQVVKSAVSVKFYDIATELISRIPLASQKARAQAELVKAYSKAKRFTQARELANTFSDAEAQTIALRSIAESEAQHLDLDTAMTTLHSISDVTGKDRALASVANVRAKLGDSEGSLSTLAQIVDDSIRDAALVKVTNTQEKGAKFSIESVTGLIHDPTFRDTAMLHYIVKEAARKGVERAATTVNRIETDAARVQAIEALVNLQVRQGDLSGALQRAKTISSEPGRYRAIQSVAVAKVRKEGAAQARHIAGLISDKGVRESTMAKIAQKSAVFGQHKAALATIDYIEEPSARAFAFANVALTQARYGMNRQARARLQDVSRELNEVENARTRGRAQGLVALAFAETGDAREAFSTAAQISNAGLRDSTYQKVALSFANDIEPVFAAESAQLIEREVTREKALDSVAAALAKKIAMTDAVAFAENLTSRRQQVRFLLGVATRKS